MESWSGLRAASVFAMTLLLACSGIDVRWDWDRAARFDQLRSWAWLPEPAAPAQSDPRLQDELLRRRIQSAVEEALAARGYVQAAAGEPDFYVAYHVGIDEKIDARTVYPGYGVGPYGRAFPGPPETYVDEYEVGTLLLDVIQAHPRELVWRGTAQSRVQDLSDPEQREARIREAVQRVFEKFPPPPAG
jgi:hypothetical protein